MSRAAADLAVAAAQLRAPRTRVRRRVSPLLASLLLLTGGLQGCVVVGASSRGGFFVWPGGLGLLLILFFALFLIRRR